VSESAVFLGDFVEERTVLLRRIPEDAVDGARMRGLFAVVGEDATFGPSNHWLVQIGRFDDGKAFRSVTREFALDKTLVAGRLYRLDLPDPAIVSRGDILALRISPRGAPTPLVGLSVVPEWGPHASRRASRG